MEEIQVRSDGPIRLMASRVTISQLADSLSVSKGTVSKALNGYSDVSNRTKARVAEAARKMGYRPLSHAQAIRTGRSRSIGLVIQADEYDGYNLFLRDFLAGISQSTSEMGWTLTVASSNSYQDFQQVVCRMVEQRKVDGFILPRILVHDPRYALLKQMGIPSVLFGRLWESEDDLITDNEAICYDIDGELAFAEAVLRMQKHGHSRIGFVGSPPEYTYAHIRRNGYIFGMEKAGLEIDDKLIISDIRTRKDGAQATQRLLETEEPPTAIIFATDEIAMGAYTVASQFNLSLGHDLSISAYDGAAWGRIMSPALTSYQVDMGRAGRRLSSLLIGRIEGKRLDDQEEIAPAKFMRGGTDGPPALSSYELGRKFRRSVNGNGSQLVRQIGERQ